MRIAVLMYIAACWVSQAACAEALSMSPRDPVSLVAQADALMRSQRPGKAIGVYRNALRSGAPRDVVNRKIAAAKAVLRRAQGHARAARKKRLPVATQAVLLGEAGVGARRAFSNEAQTTRSN
jgi:hypothetical protein